MEFSELVKYVEHDDPELLSDYLGDHTFNLRDVYERQSLLHVACFYGCINVIPLLLPCGVNSKDKNGRTPLHRVYCKDAYGIAKILLDNGADVDARDNDGCTFLHRRAYGGGGGRNEDLDLIKLLLEYKADISIVDEDSVTPLHLACARGRPKIIEFLVEQGAAIEVVDSKGATPLHHACFHGTVDIIAFLLSKGANIEARTKKGQTPLHFACKSSNLEVIELLLSKGANSNVRTIGESPLDYCETSEARDILLNSGAC